MRLLPGQVAVVTGAASGIGRSLATALSARGLSVVVADLPGDALAQATALVSGAGSEAMGVACDVRRASDVDALATATLDRFGTVDMVCLNAGVFHDVAPMWEIDEDVWDRVIDTNLRGVVHGIRSFVPILVAKGSGHVVTTGSISGLARTKFVGPYAASKHAVVGLSESLQAELAERAPAVKVTVVCPALVRTALTESILGPLPAKGEPDPAAAPSILDPDVLAARVLAGVEADELYVVPSPGSAPRIEARMHDITSAIDRSEVDT